MDGRTSADFLGRSVGGRMIGDVGSGSALQSLPQMFGEAGHRRGVERHRRLGFRLRRLRYVTMLAAEALTSASRSVDSILDAVPASSVTAAAFFFDLAALLDLAIAPPGVLVRYDTSPPASLATHE